MSSRAKNFRRRTEDMETNTEEAEPSPKPTFNRPKPRKPDPAQTRTRLSFADDEEEDTEDGPFRSSGSNRPVKANPVSAVHKLTSSSKEQRVKGKKGLSYSSSSSNPPANLQSQAGEYTKEKLLALQKNAKPLGSMPKPPPSAPKPTSLFSALDPKPVKSSNKPAVPVIVLKGLVKPPSSSAPSESVIAKEDEVEEEEEEGNGIPDQATINAIKAKRLQSLQPRHAAPEFISLDGSGVMSSRQSGGGSSDDDDGELDGRIGFLGLGDTNKGNKAPVVGVFEEGPSIVMTEGEMIMKDDKLKDLGLQEEVVEDEEDEEERKWEEEQFRKGLGQAYRFEESSSSLRAVPNQKQQQQQQQPSVFISRSAEVMSFAQQAEVAIRSVRENIAKLSHTHKSSLASLVRTEAFLSEALVEISSLEKSMEADDTKYVYMQQLREYVSVLCDFLNDKAFYIEELEEQMQKLHEKRALAVSHRRAADLSDESAEMEPAVRAAMAVLSTSASDVSSSARAAALAAKEAFARSVEAKKLDEFGRDENLKRRMDLARRAEGRKRRKTRNESKRMAFSENSIEGEVSTDESESEKDAYVSSRDELLRTAGMVFSDASEEYADLKHVKERFEGWKKRYCQAYRDAYVSLSVPAVFSPYVRLELLKWDPLYHAADFVDMKWHDLLFDYDGSGEEDEEDMDSNLIPELVEKVALPILHHEIEHCWDVFSTQKTQNAVFAAKMVINYLSLSSKALHELLGAVAVRLTESVEALDVPLWGPSVVKTVPGAGELCAYRFGMSVRLLRNICLWKDILAGPVIEKIAMDDLLRGKILRHVKSMGLDLHDAVSRLERIVHSIEGLVSGRAAGRLLEFVKELGVKLEKRHKSGAVSEEETHRLARKLKKMMIALNDYDAARAILRAFQLKEAL